MADTAPALSVHNLWKVYGPHPRALLRSPEWRQRSPADIQRETGHVVALRDISFDVAGGETFVVMGLSGSGKSTLVRCLLRLTEPTAGSITVAGQSILELSQRRLEHFRRTQTALVFQRFALLPHRTVLENAAWGLEIQGIPHAARQERAAEMLRLVGLSGWERNLPHQLSGGMQQRVGLARALATDPQFLLMDEPFSSLDPLIRRELQDTLLRIQAEARKTIIFITHDLSEALKLGGRIAIMRDGAILQMGTPEEVVGAPSDDYVIEFTRDVNKAAVMRVQSIMAAPRARVYLWQGPRVARREMRGAEVAFVVDYSDRLQGLLRHDTVTAAAVAGTKSLRELIEPVPLVVQADATVDTLLAAVMDYDWRYELLPVVDAEGRLVGELNRAMVREAASWSQPAAPLAAAA